MDLSFLQLSIPLSFIPNNQNNPLTFYSFSFLILSFLTLSFLILSLIIQTFMWDLKVLSFVKCVCWIESVDDAYKSSLHLKSSGIFWCTREGAPSQGKGPVNHHLWFKPTFLIQQQCCG